MKPTRIKPLTLLILDGWGYREEKEANAIYEANTPTWDRLWQNYPHTLLSGSGCSVGLPKGQMGNSEVGHLNMGAGRIVHQDLTRIDQSLVSKEFFQNKVLLAGLHDAKNDHKAVHVLGLLSPGGVHSHERHFYAIVEMAAKIGLTSLYLHPFLDGRDTPPKSALSSIQALETVCKNCQTGQIISLIGRYYAMDRDKRFERTESAYKLIVEGIGRFKAETAIQALESAYARGETDEFVQATAITKNGSEPITIKDGDVVIFMNFRADRARAISEALVSQTFQGFSRSYWPKLERLITLTEYDKKIPAKVAFPPQSLNNILSECLSKAGLKQLRIAETEKYAHVTFFFNGGVEKPFEGEERILIPSPKVATYDLKPEMSALPLTERIVEEIMRQEYDVIIANFANADMVGHSGNFEATVKAIEVLDHCLSLIVSALDKVGGELLITADHGNAELMFNPMTNQPHTAHTDFPVPFIYVGRSAEISKENGKLSDIAPTMLALLGLPIPSDMTGKSLVELTPLRRY